MLTCLQGFQKLKKCFIAGVSKHFLFFFIFSLTFKGLVLPEMKNLALFTHPHAIPYPQDFCSSLEHTQKKDICNEI